MSKNWYRLDGARLGSIMLFISRRRDYNWSLIFTPNIFRTKQNRKSKYLLLALYGLLNWDCFPRFWKLVLPKLSLQKLSQKAKDLTRCRRFSKHLSENE